MWFSSWVLGWVEHSENTRNEYWGEHIIFEWNSLNKKKNNWKQRRKWAKIEIKGEDIELEKAQKHRACHRHIETGTGTGRKRDIGRE